MGPWWNTKQNIQKLLVDGRGLWWGKTSLEVQQYLWDLDSNKKPGSLNEDLIHTYFLVGDYQSIKQLIYGNINFFSLSAFPVYMAFATGWSNTVKSWVGQESVMVQWHCCF